MAWNRSTTNSENQDKESFEEVEAQVDDWMNYYNNDRCNFYTR